MGEGVFKVHMYKIFFNVENVFLNISDEVVRHGFYVNQYIAKTDVEATAISMAKKNILKKMKTDKRIRWDIGSEFKFTVEEITCLNDSEQNESEQGFVWYEDKLLAS
jgi:hypothetical protein